MTLYVRWTGQRQVGRKNPRLENLFVVVGREGYGEIDGEALRRAFGDNIVDLSGMVQFGPLPAAPSIGRATRGGAAMRFWRRFNDERWQKVKDDVPDTL
jgi:hypothetical protein